MGEPSVSFVQRVRHMGCHCLLCLRCDRMSFDPTAVTQRFCEYCQMVLAESPAPCLQETGDGQAQQPAQEGSV